MRRLLAAVTALTLAAGLLTVAALGLRSQPTSARADCALIVHVAPHYLCWGPNGLIWV